MPVYTENEFSQLDTLEAPKPGPKPGAKPGPPAAGMKKDDDLPPPKKDEPQQKVYSATVFKNDEVPNAIEQLFNTQGQDVAKETKVNAASNALNDLNKMVKKAGDDGKEEVKKAQEEKQKADTKAKLDQQETDKMAKAKKEADTAKKD